MCGIAGIVAPHPARADLDLMLALLEHRGPDDLGTYVDDAAALGTARLSVVDPVGGRQPMRHPETGVVLVFNGEIFDHPEIRAELASSGFRFRTRSDTEVLLALYLAHGSGFPARLNGQFAAAIWDPRDQTLLLTRDRFGICPLFYHHDQDHFAFASELKSILTLPHVTRRLDLRALDQIFTFWTPICGRTALEGIHELEPGRTLSFRAGHLESKTYWSWPFPEKGDGSSPPIADVVDEFVARFSRAVELRLRADVEVGSYLSGGVDSSAIVAVASRLRTSPLRTYSLAFADESYDERAFQEQVARHCATSHTTVESRGADIEEAFESVVWSAETPLFRTAPAPMRRLAERVRDDGLKVVLSGEGSDEVLLGYDLFREAKIRRFWGRAPDSTSRPRLLERLYAYLPQFADSRYARLAIRSFGSSLLSDSPFYAHAIRWANNAANKAYFSEPVRSALAGYDAVADLAGSLPGSYSAADDIGRAQYLEVATLLRGYLLSSQGDRMSMGSSVEARFPFLDHEFVAYCNGLPRSYKLAGLRDKRVLRLGMRDLLPPAICNRPKFAYQAPEIRAFVRLGEARGRLAREYLSDGATEDAGLFDPGAVRLLLAKIERSGLPRFGARDNMAFVQMLSAHIFVRRFVATDVRALAKSRLPKRISRCP